MNQETIQIKDNPMRQIRIEKVLLSAGGTDKELEKSAKLLKLISGMKPQIIASTKRIPDFNVSPGLQVGARVTIRGKKSIDLLKNFLTVLDNTLRKKQVSENHFSFGIKEYIEIPGMEYQREIGIMGLDVTVVFKRAGRRVRIKKIKSGKIPKRQVITREEIMNFMKNKYDTRFTK